MSTKRRALLLGLDGATYDLLDRYCDRGLMPGFARWRSEGASGILESTNPPTTPPAWSTCVTGKNPGKHGVYDFRESFHLDRKRPLITGRSIRSRKIWDLLADVGRRSCITNFPVSYPAEEVNGVFVCGMMTPDGQADFAWPPGETERLLAKVPRYEANIDIPKYDVDQLEGARGFLDDLDASLDARIAAFWHYWEQEDWDFYFPTFVFHDRLGHLFWKFMVEGEGFDDHPHSSVVRPRIEAMYRRFDDMLVRILDERSDDLTVFMCSDHGFGSTHRFFEVNAWLESLGLLVLKGGGRLRSRAFYKAMEIGERDAVKALIPGRLQHGIRQRIRNTRSSFKNDLAEAIDWSKTKAFFPSVPVQGILICRDVVRSQSEYDEVRERIHRELRALKDPDGGTVVDQTWNREDLYSGPYLKFAPDVLFVAQDYATLGRPTLGAKEWFRDSRGTANGFHRMGGVWMAHGPGIAAGAHIDGAAIRDVTPTVLHAMGEPVPDDMDGEVLSGCFEPDWLKASPVRYVEASKYEGPGEYAHSEEDAAALTERLRGLGYVD